MTIDAEARIVVAGAGSVGCYAGGSLALAGRAVTLFLRDPLASLIADHGLVVGSLDGADRAVPPGALTLATEPGTALASADIVLVTVKVAAGAEAHPTHSVRAMMIRLLNMAASARPPPWNE